ncbi:MAG: LOG family protein [Chloroflexi bacterium]|nr:LOG family protein [Chloroflexota bacterium]
MVFGVMGSAGGEVPESAREKIYKLGAEVGKRGYTLVTGIAPGLPHDSVLGAKSEGGLVIGISPGQSFKEHIERYNSPTRGYDIIVYTGSGLMGREVENIQTCDAVVIVGGRSGTLGEFSIAYDQAKIIGVLEGTGGIADHIDELLKVINKDTGARVIGHTDPIELVKLLEQAYIDDVLPGYLELVEGHETDGELE